MKDQDLQLIFLVHSTFILFSCYYTQYTVKLVKCMCKLLLHFYYAQCINSDPQGLVYTHLFYGPLYFVRDYPGEPAPEQSGFY